MPLPGQFFLHDETQVFFIINNKKFCHRKIREALESVKVGSDVEMSALLVCRDRQKNGEGRAFAEVGSNAEAAAVVGDYAVTDRKPEARSFAYLFGRKERLENL